MHVKGNTPVRESSRGSVLELLAFILLVVVMIASVLVGGWPTQDGGIWPDHPDRAIWMDAAWRVASGQVPHVDFFTPIGSAWLYVNSLPVVLFGPNYAALPYGVAIVMVLAALVIWHMIKPSAGWVYACLALLYVHKLFFQSQFLDYNEIALFLFLVVLLSVAVPSKKYRTLYAVYGGASLALLLFWKVNFFAATLAIVALSVIIYQRSIQWCVTFAISFVIIFVAVAWSIDWHVGEVFAQYRIPAEIKGGRTLVDVFSIKAHARVTWNVVGYVLVAGLIFWLGRQFRPCERFEWARDDRFAVFIFLGLLWLQNAFCLTNASLWAPHIVPWVVLLVGTWGATSSNVVTSHMIGDFRTKDTLLIASVVLMVAFWANTAIPRILKAQEFIATRNAPLNYSMESYPVSVSDGLMLIRTHALEDGRIGALAYANPFPALLKSSPPRHLPLWWSIHDSLNVNNPPDARDVWSDVDVLMEPIWHINEHGNQQTSYMKNIYGDYLSENFAVVAESKYWIVWVRKFRDMQVDARV